MSHFQQFSENAAARFCASAPYESRPPHNPNVPSDEQQQSTSVVSSCQQPVDINAPPFVTSMHNGENSDLQRVIREQKLHFELQKCEIQELREQHGRECKKQELQLEFRKQEMQEMRNQLDHLLNFLAAPMQGTPNYIAGISPHSYESNPPLQQPNNNPQQSQPFLVGYNEIVSCTQKETRENSNEAPARAAQNTAVEKSVSMGMRLPTARPLCLPTSGDAGQAATAPAAIYGVAAPGAAQNFVASAAAGAGNPARNSFPMSGSPAAMKCYTKLPPLEPFDPSNSEKRDFKLFEIEFEQRMRMDGVPFYLWADRLLLFLRGEARSYMYKLTNSRPVGEPLDYNALIEILTSVFQIDTSLDYFHRRLLAMAWDPSEISVDQHCMQIRLLIMRVFPNMANSWGELTRSHLLRTLPHDFHEHVCGRSNSTLLDLLISIRSLVQIRIERGTLKLATKSKQSSTSVSTVSGENTPPPPPPNQPQNLGQRTFSNANFPSSPSYNNQPFYKQEEPRCLVCRSPNHFFRECSTYLFRKRRKRTDATDDPPSPTPVDVNSSIVTPGRKRARRKGKGVKPKGSAVLVEGPPSVSALGPDPVGLPPRPSQLGVGPDPARAGPAGGSPQGKKEAILAPSHLKRDHLSSPMGMVCDSDGVP